MKKPLSVLDKEKQKIKNEINHLNIEMKELEEEKQNLISIKGSLSAELMSINKAIKLLENK